MTRATHLAARIATNEALDRVHAAWIAAAPKPPPTETDLRHAADRRAVARMTRAGRRAGDDGRAMLQMADWLRLADSHCA